MKFILMKAATTALFLMLVSVGVAHADRCEDMEDELTDLMDESLIVAEEENRNCASFISDVLSTVELGIKVATAKRKYPDAYFSCYSCYSISRNLDKAKNYCPSKIRGNLRKAYRLWNRYESRCNG